jgi:hypothetical protein
MNWFEGEIAQAIITSKAKQAIFVVYVHGKVLSDFVNLVHNGHLINRKR